jgi:hypothetical protein
MAYTVFTTYILESTGATNGRGYSPAIHCNYIKSLVLDTDTPDIMELNISFPNGNDFKFLSDNIGNGTGFTANKIYALIQWVSGTTNVKPISYEWRKYDLTNQIKTDGSNLTASELTGTSLVVKLNGYYNPAIFVPYNLTYLNYPASAIGNNLSLGDEVYFLGNVTTEIHADVYSTDLSILLNYQEFNSTTNPTWDGTSKVSISEIGIYDSNKNLVAIGKLNDPIDKDSTIARTILFALDF